VIYRVAPSPGGVARREGPGEVVAADETSVWCAISERLDGMGGAYCENCDIAIAVSAD